MQSGGKKFHSVSAGIWTRSLLITSAALYQLRYPNPHASIEYIIMHGFLLVFSSLRIFQMFFDCCCFLFVFSSEENEEYSQASLRRASRRFSCKVRSSVADSECSKVKANSQMKEAALELLSYFSQRNLDALQRCIRNTLESIRKRITASMMAQYGWFTWFFLCKVLVMQLGVVKGLNYTEEYNGQLWPCFKVTGGSETSFQIVYFRFVPDVV